MPARQNHRRAATAPKPRRPRRIGEIDEFDLIDRLTRRLPAPRLKSPHGPGDDAAVLAAGPSTDTLITTDTLVDGIHFRRDWFTPAEVGFRALEVNLSDIAAMGGVPTSALVSLVLPVELEVDAIERLYDGLARSARRARVAVVGGNVTRGGELSIGITLLGRPATPRARPVTRAGARPGDILVMTGWPGLAAAGRRLLEESGDGPDLWVAGRPAAGGASLSGFALADRLAARALQRYLLPDARLDAGLRLAAAGATALIDISDGLAADLHHLCDASRCGVRLDSAALPRLTGFDAICAVRRWKSEELMLLGGDDYELLAAVPPGAVAALTGSGGRRRGVPFTVIGEFTTSRRGRRVVRDGEARPLPAEGWRHFGR